MMRFSANLGFLWTELALDQAIHAAARAGFAAVECHWPYDIAPDKIAAALAQTGMPMLSLNTRPGRMAIGEFGLAALPGRSADARAAIQEAITYAHAIDASAIHVMSGKAKGQAARATFTENLRFAVEHAGDRMILIEPINSHDVPGYFLDNLHDAIALIAEIGAPNLRLMADCYHLAQMGHDVVATLQAVAPMLGHVQIAGHPGRGAPDCGTLDYGAIFGALASLGWDQPIGAEYRPNGPTEPTLGWLEQSKR